MIDPGFVLVWNDIPIDYQFGVYEPGESWWVARGRNARGEIVRIRVEQGPYDELEIVAVGGLAHHVAGEGLHGWWCRPDPRCQNMARSWSIFDGPSDLSILV